jgi:trk system potassium uptake protein TrkA
MRIIIAGAGDVGFHLAELLSIENQDIVIIDQNQEVLDYAASRLDIMALNGDCATFEVLERAGAARAGLVLAVTTSEKTNIITAILSKKLGAKQTVARINSPGYLDQERKQLFRELGVDEMISPIRLAAEEISRLLRQSSFTDIYHFEEGKISLVGITLSESSPVLNIKLSQLPQHALAIQLRPVIILRGNKTIIPKGDDMLLKGDLVYFISKKETIVELRTLFGCKEHKVKSVMILGGMELGYAVATILQKEYRVTLIEKDRSYCKELAEKLEDSLIVYGSYSNFDLMLDEGLEQMDAFVALTDNSETNIIASLTAKNHGVFKTVARVESKEYTYVSQNIGVDSLVNKKLFAANEIFRLIRKGKVQAFTALSGVDAEVIEYLVHKGNKITKKPIKELRFPQNALIGAVIRGDDTFIPGGDFQLELDDKVVVLSKHEDMNKVEQFFK